MNIKLPKKITDRELDEFVHHIYSNYKSVPSDKYSFDFTEVEFIGNQELLLLSGLLKSFVESGIQFEVIFFKRGVPTSQISDRVKRQIIQFWEVWKIWKIVPKAEYDKYFGIDGNSVARLQNELNYFPRLSEIYTRHGVTPFVSLNYIHNYNEIDVQHIISPIYKLNSVIEDLLRRNDCHHPFTSHSLSTIITEELYLNFLDHTTKSAFTNFELFSFLSISFQSKLDESKLTSTEIQQRKALNFHTECLNESINFFYDSKTKKYKNIPYIQFSFLDFGQGIVESLKETFKKINPNHKSQNYDSDILRFAFNHDSSRHPIFHQKNAFDQFIPRGLFDVLTIVRRYNGLLIVRSNFGKILFDFSNQSDIDKAFSYFGSNNLYFPGTLISLYIPAIEDSSKLNVSAIKPDVVFAKVKPDNKKYISINFIAKKLKGLNKEDLYPTLLKELKESICSSHDHSLVFVSFRGCEIERRIIKKTIYFLLTDYNVNNKNNVVILNSLPENLADEISTEILTLNDALKNYKLHPLPIIDFDKNTDDVNVRWLGIFDESDKKKLNELLYDTYSIAKSDFRDNANISGHLNEFDSYGNLISNFPNRHDIISFYKIEDNFFISKQVEELLEKYNCIKKDDKARLYLCNGNYYQREYVELNNLVNDKNACNTVTQLLYDKLIKKIKKLDGFKFIGITTTSHKLLKSLESQNLISKEDYISLDNYQTFENDLNEENIDVNKKYILICDVVSTGYLTKRLNAKLSLFGTSIEHIVAVTSILHSDFETTKIFLEVFEEKLLYLYKYPIQKFKRDEIAKDIFSKEIIRVNPHTNIPITLSIEETNFNDSVIFHSSIHYRKETNEIEIKNKFLSSIKQEFIHVGFYEFNNVIHPYFFNTVAILKELGEDLLKDIFLKINNSSFKTDKIQIFYPRKSGIESFDFNRLKNVLDNHAIEEIEIERFGTPEGWRFPHNTDYLSAKIENSFCFILDDGSCSGDSLIQMIDEISFYSAKEIVLLCIIGRVNDHKREFFSRLERIKVKQGNSIKIAIYFACHWHIPTYYMDDNPTSKEIHWLEDIIALQNVPQGIRNIALRVIKEITPKSGKHFKDYKYLPKAIVGSEKIMPKKELLLIREELGKVIGYRLYKESFKFFDCFIKKYERKKKSKDRYKEIELLCATFIYEPYLYERIVGILPDVVEQIERFVRVLIFSDQRIYDRLTYHWNKLDIIHLFFIVFKNEKLLNELNEENFKKLIAYTDTKDPALNYVLYKLLNYFAIKDSQLANIKYDSQLKELLNKLKDDNTSSSKEIRKYCNFISSLPSRGDFDSQLTSLVDNYNKQKEPEFHVDKISFGHNISYILALIRDSINNIEEEKTLDKEKIELIKERWFEILNFINPILSFSIRFKEFLLPFPYFRLIHKVESGASSLRGMVGFNEDVIFSLNESFNDVEKLKGVEKNIVRIQTDFKIDSDFYKLINKRQSNLSHLVKELHSDIASLSKAVDVAGEELIKPDYLINIPEVYSDILIKRELTTNLKNHSKKETNSRVAINYSMIADKEIEMRISNVISEQEFNKGNGEGIKCLNLLSDSDLFGFKYRSKIEDLNFIQTLIFRIQKNGYEKN